MPLSRRRFARLALGGTAATAVGAFTIRTAAQNTPQTERRKPVPGRGISNALVLGVTANQINNPNARAATDSNQTDLGDESGVANTASNVTRTIAVQSLDLGSKRVAPYQQTQATLARGEEITGFSASANGALTVSTNRSAEAGRVISIKGGSSKPVDIRGVNQQQQLGSLATAEDGSVTGLVNNEAGDGSASIVKVNTNTGEVQNQQQLPQDKLFKNVVKCPGGTTYAISTGFRGETSLYNVNTGASITLTLKGKTWVDGVSSLVCSSNGQLLALAAERYKYPKSLYSIDPNSGVMTYLSDFNVAAITAAPPTKPVAR